MRVGEQLRFHANLAVAFAQGMLMVPVVSVDVPTRQMSIMRFVACLRCLGCRGW